MRSVSSVSAGLMLVAVLMGLACSREAARVRTVFSVEGMHCDACSTSITTALEKVEGVDEATADHEMGIAEAIYRPREVDPDKLKAEIEKLGYTVTGMETKPIEG